MIERNMKDGKKRKALQIKITFKNVLPVCLFSSNPLLWVISLCAQVSFSFPSAASVGEERLLWSDHSIDSCTLSDCCWSCLRAGQTKQGFENSWVTILQNYYLNVKIIVPWYSLQVPRSRFVFPINVLHRSTLSKIFSKWFWQTWTCWDIWEHLKHHTDVLKCKTHANDKQV